MDNGAQFLCIKNFYIVNYGLVTSVVGRLRDHIQAWQEIGASSVVLEWIENGVNIQFEAVPGEFRAPNHPGARANAVFVSTEIEKLVSQGAVKKCPFGEIPKIISPLNAVPKKGKTKLRLVIDMRHVNSFIKAPKFKYEGHKDAATILERDDWLFTIDFKSGYHHLSINKNFWQYFGFYWEGTYYYFVVLPFGLTTAPWIFTKTVKQILKFWRKKFIRSMGYVDDLLFAEKSQFAASQLVIQIVNDLDKFGWVIELEKSNLVPTQKAISLGLEIDTVRGIFVVPADKRDRLLESIRYALSHDKFGDLTVRDVARVVGRLCSMFIAVMPVRWCTVELYARMNSLLYEGCIGGPSIFRYTKERWYMRIKLSLGATAELAWWLQNFDEFNGKQIWLPTESLVITTDASPLGWGAWCGSITAGGSYNIQESSMDQSCRELLAVFNALRIFVLQSQNCN